ncbi:MAG: hypothetical protein ACREUT_03415, partial [Steroidobacteraceae bacterium]
MRAWGLVVAPLIAFAFVAAGDAAPRAQRRAGTELGFAVFETQCTRCHGNPAAAQTRAPDPAVIRQMSPERIYG